MVRREGRPRRAAQARKQGPDRKSLVKYVDHPPPALGARSLARWLALRSGSIDLRTIRIAIDRWMRPRDSCDHRRTARRLIELPCSPGGRTWSAV